MPEQAKELGAPDLLREAARLIDRALLKLDHRSAPCCTCSRMLQEHRGHGRVTEQVGGWPRRLRDMADELQKMPEQDPQRGYDASVRAFHAAGRK